MAVAHELPTLSLNNFAEGSAEELFAEALKDALKNMQDPNTDWKAKRQIVLKFTFVPDEERKMAGVSVQCQTKLPSIKPVPSVVYMGQEKGELVAVEAPRQRDMFQSPTGKPRPVEAPANGS